MDEIIVAEILNSTYAVSTEDGEKIYTLVNKKLSENSSIAIDFKDVDIIVSTFLNAAIGQLYGIYPTEFIQKHLTITNMSNEDLEVLKKVTDRAKTYFADMKGFDKVFKKHFPDASE